MKIKRRGHFEQWEAFGERWTVVRSKGARYGRYGRYLSSNLIYVPGTVTAKNMPNKKRESVGRLMARWYSLHHPLTDVYVSMPFSLEIYRHGKLLVSECE